MCKKNEQMTLKNGWWVYFVTCADGTLYTGITTNINRRIEQHNGLRAGGARYTAARRPVSLAYLEPSDNRSLASKREYVLRKLPKKQKLALVAAFKQE